MKAVFALCLVACIVLAVTAQHHHNQGDHHHHHEHNCQQNGCQGHNIQCPDGETLGCADTGECVCFVSVKAKRNEGHHNCDNCHGNCNNGGTWICDAHFGCICQE